MRVLRAWHQSGPRRMACGSHLAATLTITEGIPARNVRLVTLPRPRRTPPIGRGLRTRHILLTTGVDDRPAREASRRGIRLSGGNHEPDREPDQADHRAPVAVVELKVRWPAAECHGWRAARGKPGAGLPR